jgi:hypothetical protein
MNAEVADFGIAMVALVVSRNSSGETEGVHNKQRA